MKLEEENSNYWENVPKRRGLRKETIGRMERDKSMVWGPRYKMQRSKARDKVGVERNVPHMVKPLRSYNPCDQVVTEIS